MESSPRSTSRASSPSPTQARSAAIIEDGILTGVTGAAVVAVWFLILDMARGRIFFTSSLLGSVVFLGQSPDQVISVNGFIVFAYTGLHVVLFLLAGLVIAWMFSMFEHNPHFGIILLVRGNPLYIRGSHFSKSHGSHRISGCGIRQSLRRNRHVQVPDSTTPDGANAAPACVARRVNPDQVSL
jgi:hypothetical protein